MTRVFMQRVTWRMVGLIASEHAIIVSAVTFATFVRQGAAHTFTSHQLPKAFLVALVSQVCLYYAELYDFSTLRNRRDLFIRLLQALGSTSLILALLYFWFPILVLGRGVFLFSSLLVLTIVGGWRIVYGWVTGRLRHRERLLLVGTNAAAVSLARELYERQDLGVHIVGFVDPDPARVGMPVINPGVIGTLQDIPEIIRSREVDRVVVSLADARGKLPIEQLLELKLGGVAFDHLASVYEEYTGKIAVENLRPSWLIFSEGFRKSKSLETIKRTVDIVGAGAGLILLLPIMLLTAAVIKMTSAGPVIYKQRRVGKNGRAFDLYKFRSMRHNAEALTGAVWASADDNRATAVGRWIRPTRIDELAQFWNVLRGDMSIVGPRPERPEFVEELTRRIPFYGQRHVVKPGLTGWAQVRYSYGSSVEDALEKLQYELFYIKNMSVGFDLFIMFKTIQTIVLRRGT